ncbi:MAG: hypothetical protein LIP01_08920 [Tannerellaceae bacterium]|nr:hypothetical protein [Tannerellaceae bacterium]
MKLKMNDSEKTVITSIDTEISRAADYDENGNYYYIEINGKRLKYRAETKQKDSQKDFNKLLKKGSHKSL